MNHKISLPRICSCLLFNLILLQSIKSCFCSIDPNYTACVPKSCGVVGSEINISYPFWINGQQESRCGFPGFDVSCNTQNETIIRLFGSNYTIKNIYNNNQSIRVIDSNLASLSEGEACSVPFENLTLHGDRFMFGLNYTKLYIVSSCVPEIWRDLARYKVSGCLSRNESDPVFAILKNEFSNLAGKVAGKCEKVVEVPVELGGDEDINGTMGGENWWKYFVDEVFKRGIMLKWIASNCSVCTESGGRCGFDVNNHQFMCFCTDRPHFHSCDRRATMSRRMKLLALGLGLGLPSAIGLFLMLLWCLHKKKYGRPTMISRNLSRCSKSTSYLEGGSVYYGVPVFSYRELEEATNNFDSKKQLGDGGFGTVYHGILRDGREVAVKRLHESNYKRVEQFMNEIKIITCLRHKNLVTLYGCTSRHSRELLLVYEYIPNGTVADHLNGDLATQYPLKWPIRMSIAIETATALAYLHATDIIHRDVKTNNILLDSNFCVKVADFGLSRVCPLDVTHVSTAPQGTPGYVDPEYHQCYQLTDKSDVYSFGVVLIELISSLPAVDISRHRHEINLANLAINKITNHAYNDLIDPFLGFDSDSSVEKMTIAVAELAFRCLQSDKEMRPAMDEVLEILKRIEQSGGSKSKDDKNIIEEEVEEMVASDVRIPPPSPENDEVGLLGKIRPPFSPISVTDRWISTNTTPSTSA